MLKQYKRAEDILKQKKKEAHEFDERVLQLKRMEHEHELFGSSDSKTEITSGTLVSAASNFTHNTDFKALKKFASASSPQEKKNKIPGTSFDTKSLSKYAVVTEEKRHKQQGDTSLTATAPPFTRVKKTRACCAFLRLQIRMYQEKSKLVEKKRLDKLSPQERLIDSKLKEKNFIVQQLFISNKEGRDPGFSLPPAPWWLRVLVDFISFTLVLFFSYFIVAFGFYYGQDVGKSIH